MDQEKLKELLSKYSNGQCTPKEARLLDEWYDAITTNKKPFEDTNHELIIKERAWSAITRAMDHVNEGKQMRSRNLIALAPWRMIGIAATIVLILTIVLPSVTSVSPLPTLDVKQVLTSEIIQSVGNNGTEPITLTLPDSSRVTLYPASRIQYAQSFVSKDRSVFLEGEALFDVTRDEQRPFLVYTNGLTTQVLGTSFLIKAYDEQKEITVTVKTGRVAVFKNLVSQKAPDDHPDEVILTPNQQLVYKRDRKIALRTLVDQPEPVAAQLTNPHDYKNMRVIDILSSLEQAYAIKIHYDSTIMSGCTLTSDLSDEGFYEQIAILCNALGAEYRISEDAVIISATSCTKAEK